MEAADLAGASTPFKPVCSSDSICGLLVQNQDSFAIWRKARSHQEHKPLASSPQPLPCKGTRRLFDVRIGGRAGGTGCCDIEFVDNLTVAGLEIPVRFGRVATIVECNEERPKLLGAAGLIRGIHVRPDIIASWPTAVG